MEPGFEHGGQTAVSVPLSITLYCLLTCTVLLKPDNSPTAKALFISSLYRGGQKFSNVITWSHATSKCQSHNWNSELSKAIFMIIAPGFLSLCTIDVLDWIISCCGGQAVLCIGGCLAASLPTGCQWHHPPSHDNENDKRHCQISPEEQQSCPHWEPQLSASPARCTALGV